MRSTLTRNAPAALAMIVELVLKLAAVAHSLGGEQCLDVGRLVLERHAG
jgi:hypothetical protein